MMCELPQVFLPQSLYLYEKDERGKVKVKALAICQQCMPKHFRALDCFQNVLDSINHTIDISKLNEVNGDIHGIPFYSEGNEEKGERWFQIPIGQGIWANMSYSNLLVPYIKAWFILIVETTIRKFKQFFTFCQNHPDIQYRTPKPGTSIKCQYCDMFNCATCMIWHPMKNKYAVIDVPLFRRCPNSFFPTYKTGCCKKMTCPNCGKS